MAMCNEKTKGMTKADADKARSECMKADLARRVAEYGWVTSCPPSRTDKAAPGNRLPPCFICAPIAPE